VNILAQADTGDQRGTIMSIVAWLFIGVVAGFIASKVINKRGEGFFMDLILGLVGSLVGGFLFRLIGIGGYGGIGFSIIVATIGAIILLLIYHKLIRPRAGTTV
jgi:uncharacterized membrane protein YeaQ/YmgE (transglycosylase-associated protein family)